MEWGTRHNIRVKISDTGAKSIYTSVDGVYARGGTDLNRALGIARNYFTSNQVGDIVKIRETLPISRTKRWEVIE